VVSTISIGSLALAEEANGPGKVKNAGAPVQEELLVTDGQGNPLDVSPHGATGKTRADRRIHDPQAVPTVERGQAWWPFATPLAKDPGARRPVESLREEEIDVKGVVTIDVREPEKALAGLPHDLRRSESRRPGGADFYLIKIRGFSRTQNEVDALEDAGAVLGEYINVNTYIAELPEAAVATVRALPFVTFVGAYEPAFKISPRIGLEKIPVHEAYDQDTGREKPWALEVVLHKGATTREVLDELADLSLFPPEADVVESDQQAIIIVRTAPEFIPMLSKITGIKWIAEKAYPALDASSTSPTVNPVLLQNNGVFTTNTVTGWKLWNVGLDGNASGTAQIVTMMDSGMASTAYHFSDNTVSHGTFGAAHRKVVGYDNYGGDLCATNYFQFDGGHGTATSQHAVGSISNMTSNPDTVHTPNVHYDNGIARDGKLYFQDIGNSSGSLNPPVDLGPSITAAIAKGSFIQNHSWSAATPTYDSFAFFLDAAMFSNPNFVVTESSGNRGAGGTSTIGNTCTTKNGICVGGTDPANADQLFIDCSWDGLAACSTNDLGSSRGPVSGSGRVKPDIMAYMANINFVGGEQEAENRSHLMCQTDATKTPYWDWTNNSLSGGTSFAAPEVAGLAALVRDYFLAGYYPSGTATPADAQTPSGSLVKAVILASGEDMATTSWPSPFPILERYGSDVGYGRVNLPAALHIGPGAPFLWVKNNDALGDGATKSFSFSINGNSIPLRVMLAFYDAAGDALQEDADLRVTIGGNVYRGNVMANGWSVVGGGFDHTNTTEGVFLDAAHGLPASGTVQVEVIGFNNPAGSTYSLVVVGDVTGQDVVQVSFDAGKYSCNAAMEITVNDAGATSPVSVTVTSRNAASAIIDTELVSLTGSGGVFTGTLVGGTGIAVVDGGTVTATYAAVTPSVASIVCQATLADGGSFITGGCDNDAAGTNPFSGPLSNGGQNEFYAKYMDANENSAYTFGFVNQTGAPLSDVYVNLSFSGAGASKMTVLNNPVHVGAVPTDGLTGAVFQVRTDPTAAGLTSVNMDFDITSPADGFTTPKRLTQVKLLQANDVVLRQQRCSVFNTAAAFSLWFESPVAGHPLSPWRWSGSASAPATVGSETRVDGTCFNGTTNSAAMVGNSGITATSNFTGNSDSMLLQRFQPAFTGNGPSGQPWRYAWKWHSFYGSSETPGATTGIWGAFYDYRWNQAVNPTGDQAREFPLGILDFQSNWFDFPPGSWNWETANTGTPDNPNAATFAPNQVILVFPSSASGTAAAGTWFAYGHEHADYTVFGGISSATTRRDIALDNDNLVYDEFYAAAQPGGSCGPGGQVGLVAFDRYAYNNCPSSTAVLSITDVNAVSPLSVTLSSPGTGDSEVVTLTGSAPFFTGSVTLATDAGGGADDGTLLVLPDETITVSYSDTNPVGTSTAFANVGCRGGDVVFDSAILVSDNGDNDGVADNNETVTVDLRIRNNAATPLTNTRVQLVGTSANIDCIGDPQALYGTVGAGSTATNPVSDRFQFHVKSDVACADWQVPPRASFTVLISGDGVDGASELQTFTIDLDLDNQIVGGYTLSQNFAADPGWTTAITPTENTGCESETYVNNFHWCAACGNAGGGYGAWVGNSAFGTSGQNYSDTDSSTLYSPVLTANGATTLQFQVAYRTEETWDGAIVQYKINSGDWELLEFTTPAQAPTTAGNACSPIAPSTPGWTGTGTSWTTTDAAGVPTANGDTLQFRWRLGTDVSVQGSTYGGYGVDNVTVTNLLQTKVCEPVRNTGLPGCSLCVTAPNGTPCDDGNPCTQTDSCQGGTCVGSNPVPAPGDVGNTVSVNKAGTDANLAWTLAPNATNSDALRGGLNAFPIGPGGGEELCFPNIAGTVLTDPAVPSVGSGYWYLIRGRNTCAGAGTYGNQGLSGSPGALRVSATCP
jgi:hypothetical protein